MFYKFKKLWHLKKCVTVGNGLHLQKSVTVPKYGKRSHI